LVNDRIRICHSLIACAALLGCLFCALGVIQRPTYQITRHRSHHVPYCWQTRVQYEGHTFRECLSAALTFRCILLLASLRNTAVEPAHRIAMRTFAAAATVRFL
jgi:hypothetical protein